MKGKNVLLIVLCILIGIFFIFNINCFKTSGADCSINFNFVIDGGTIYSLVFITILICLIIFMCLDKNLIRSLYYLVIGIIIVVGIYIEDIFIRNIFDGKFNFVIHSIVILIFAIILLFGVDELKKYLERRLK